MSLRLTNLAVPVSAPERQKNTFLTYKEKAHLHRPPPRLLVWKKGKEKRKRKRKGEEKKKERNAYVFKGIRLQGDMDTACNHLSARFPETYLLSGTVC